MKNLTNYYNLTNPQKAILSIEQYYKNTNVNNICGTVLIKDKVDFDKLIEAIQILIKDNDSFNLRLCFNEKQEFVQYLSDKYDLNTNVILLNNENELSDLENKIANSKFELINSQLFNFQLFNLSNNYGGFILNVHHIISDACSESLVASKVIEIYSSLLKKEIPNIKPSSYIEYIHSEKEYIESSKFQKDKEYWETLFNKAYEIATIPSNKKTSMLSCIAKRKSFVIPKNKMHEVNEFCSSNKISAFNFFMAIYAIYIEKLTNVDDFIIGTPILNRSNFAEKNTTGMFISTMPFKFSIDINSTFSDFAKSIAFNSLSMLRHQKYPYQNILEYTREKNISTSNLYDILISYQNSKNNRNTSDIPYETRWIFNNTVSDTMQIHLSDMDDEGILNIAYDYRIDKYDDKDINVIHDRICFMIEQVLQSNSLFIKDIEIVTPDEKNQLLNVFNNTLLNYDKNKTVIDYFEEQVNKTPNNIALIYKGKSLTYFNLNEKVNSLARFLRNNHIKNNCIVGVMLNRSLEMITAILAVLKAGGAYIPIDPEYPEERISFMLSQSKSTVLISQKHLKNKFQEIDFKGDVIYADFSEENIYSLDGSNLDKISKPSDLSYIIYTSGSTGTPKGVMLTQQTFSNFVASMFDKIDYLNDNIPHSIVSITTVSFDIFAFETLVSLCSGLKLFMTDEKQQKITVELETLILENNIEIIQSTPSVMNFHLENSLVNGFSNLKYIMLAGEQLPKQLVDKIKIISPNCTVYNGYGPSETTIFSAVQDVTSLDFITIGKPIANTQIYILNNNLSLLPPNTVGEIYIAGDGVGKGYLNRDDLTEERYIPNPFKNNSIMYRTGDLGMWLSNGSIECMGRVDHQVKLRGLRIELGEIEECINSFDISANIKSAVIIKEENNKTTLNAFISSKLPVNAEKLKSYLSSKLPTYMLPNTYNFLDKLPLTPNGKIDRNALLTHKLDIKKDIIPPRNEIDKYLIEELKNVFKFDNISIIDSFFELGGDSLAAINLCTKISGKYNIDFTVKDIFENPIIQDLSDMISLSSVKTDLYPLFKSDKKEFYHLSSAQKRVYYSSKIAGDNSTLYNMPGVIIFKKKPDVVRLNECFEKLIQRHSSLRTFFEVTNGEVYQKVLDNVSFKIEELTCEEKEINEIAKDFIKPFDLSKAPLLRACLVKQKNQFLLLFDMHHIISDGSSLSILVNELCNIYNGNSLTELPFDYVSYAEWEFNTLKSDNLKSVKDFWINQFKSDIPVLNLQTDFPRPAIQSFEGEKVYKVINCDLAKKINNLAKELDVSTYMLLLSAYYILLFKYSSQEDIVVGTPSYGRNREELLNIIGMFVNSLPLKNHIEDSMSFSEFLNEIKTNCLDAFTYTSYPFDELVKDLNIIRDNSRNPLFDTMFTYQNNGFTKIAFDGANSDIYIPDTKLSKFDLSLEVVPTENGEFNLNFEYCTKLFKKDTIERFSNHFINILENLIVNHDLKIMDIDILSQEEKHKILYEFNNTKIDYPKDKTIIELFEEQVEKTPNNIALVFEDKKLTYKELNEKANNLAWYLRKIGLKRNDVVSIMVNRSLELLISIIGVLKSGSCYIPIDPNYPKDRTQYMLTNSNSKLLLISSSLNDMIDFDNKVIVDLTDNYFIDNNNNLPNINKPDDISYIIYTSGSTGKPKGVVLKQHSLTNLAYFLNEYVCFFKDNNYISMGSVTTASFDIFIFETLIAMQKGLKVVIANEDEQRLPSKLNLFIKNNNIKAIQMTPSRMRIFIDSIQECPNLSNLDYVVLAGEPLPNNLLKDLLDIGIKKVYNGYGPSETTVFSSFTDVTDYRVVNIGKPLGNTKMYILDKNLSPIPIGTPGELYIAGDGVGKGYLNDRENTNSKFILNPFEKESIMYKTGDVCKFLNNGEIAYLERLDNQVKIRGLRIELEEIEAKLLDIPAIQKAKVVKQSIENRDFISAYYILTTPLKTSEIRKTLSASLPAYMVPSYFTELNDFPYTPNGKIDKNALPLPDIAKDISDIEYIAPRNEAENTLVEILKEILKISKISILDNFFGLGGDSLTAIVLCTNIKKKLGIDLSFKDVIEHPIIEDLASIISKSNASQNMPSIIRLNEKREFYPTSSAQKRIYMASSLEDNSTLYNITGGVLLDSMPDIKKLQKAFDTVISRHDSLRTYFEVINGNIMQKIVDNLEVKIDIQNVNTNNIDDLFDSYQSAFNLNKPPLFKVFLLKLPNDKIFLILDVHHIIFDGTSLNLLIKEISYVYNGEELSNLDIAYKDFAIWEENQLLNNGFEESKKFWINQFENDIPILNMPETFARPANKNYDGDTFVKYLSKELTEKINNFAKLHNVTPYMLMLTIYYILLYKYTNQEDIVVGTPTSRKIISRIRTSFRYVC